ncbi:MAG: DUF1573 domain-containing protein [Nitrospirae bacterium]|nr:DUF1573 domain-containing protein [Nitrospirota bacterium]
MEIEPGQSGFVTVTYKSDEEPGKTQKGVEVWTNDPDKAMTNLVVHGVVVEPGNKGK